jgi:hypothetical protein
MPDVREVFEMVKQQTQPDVDSWVEQERRLGRAARNRKMGALALVVALAVGAAILVMSNVGQKSSGPASPGPASATPPSTSDLSWVPGYSPKLSPDGTTIAFLRDPEDQHRRDMGMNPYVLQVWLINADGSGLRKLAQLPGCCIVIRGDLQWSKDGSSIVLIADGQTRFDVATGRRLPMRSSTG